MAQRKTLTKRQVDVLRWVSEGCPDERVEDANYSASISAGALRNRGFVTTKGSGASWSAAITHAGREYLAQVDGPNPPVPRDNVPASQRLIDELVSAGGSLVVPDLWGYRSRGQPDYERRVACAERYGAVPSGKTLVVTHQAGNLRIELRDVPEGTPTEVLPVPVPERVPRYHPVVIEFREQRDRLEVSGAQLPRVCPILQGLVVEAERRGFLVRGPAAARVREYGKSEWSGDRDGHLSVTVGDVTVTLRIREDGVRGRTIYARSQSDYDGYASVAGARRIAYDAGAKGTVRVSILAPNAAHRPSSWGDGKKQTLEACLPAVLREIEARAAQEREHRTLALEEAERRRLAWEDAQALARGRYVEHQRGRVLDAQVAAWEHATAIRAYCDAIERRYPIHAGALEWVAFARARADALDPLATTPTLPEAPADVSAADLQPFFEGMGACGPGQRT